MKLSENDNSKNNEAIFQYLDELIDKKQAQKPRKQIGYKLPKQA